MEDPWPDYVSAIDELSGALDDAPITPELSDRIDSAIAAVIRTSLRTADIDDPRLVEELESYVRRPLTR
jgi:hypothetical protein